MRTFRGIIAAAGVFGLYYLLGVFVSGNWNSAEWDTLVKFMTLPVALAVMALAFIEATDYRE